MKTATSNQTEVINDLLRINLDRVEGYEKAAAQTKDEDRDLRNLFHSMAQQSQTFASELRKHIFAEGEEPASSSTTAGKIYRTWMDLKIAFTGKDRKAILSSCEFGEDAAQRAYRSALEDPYDLMPEVRALVTSQQTQLLKSHDHVKALRDQEPK